MAVQLFSARSSSLYRIMTCLAACIISWAIIGPNFDYMNVIYSRQVCRHIAQRHEWRRLRPHQQTEFLNAVKCLQTVPAHSASPARTRFDDFQALHIELTDELHRVGQFLPWHRWFTQLFQESLEKECGFSGTIPYWDWSEDVDAMNTTVYSPVYDPVYGFGGNGAPTAPGYDGPFGNWSDIAQWTGGGCVLDGPFASYELSLGPGRMKTPHCLQRAFSPDAMTHLSSSRVQKALDQPSFAEFDISIEGGADLSFENPHVGGHFAIGGEMFSRYSSPGDPLFYVHHANIDRIWWKWQEMNPSMRLFDIGGRSSVDPPFVNVTLEFMLKMGDVGPTVPIREVMDTHTHRLCYTYV